MKNNNFGKIVEIAILIAGLLLTAAIVVAIPLKSYHDYADYLEKLIEMSKPEPKPVLESITVDLKEGVEYFDNDLAEPKAEDFLVVANYTLDGEAYSEEIAAGKFSFHVETDFYAVGGDIQITYKNKIEILHIDLTPVEIQSLSITQKPYTVKYQTGTSFSADGLILSAVYNDGSTKRIDPEKYIINAQQTLTTSDTSVSVGYTEGGKRYTVDIPIGVVDHLDNGTVIALTLAGDAIVQHGQKLSNTQMEINAVYESGNRVPLNKSEYTVSGGDTVAKFGKAYTVTVTYNENPALSLPTGVIVRSTIQGEDGIIVGGSRKTETEYAVVDGVITNLNKGVSFAGDFGKTVLKGGEGSLTLTINSESAVVGNITMRCGNSYCCFVNGADKSAGYRMLPLQINTILDVTVNGVEIEIPNTVVLKGTDVNKDYQPLYGIYYEFTFENIALEAGTNVVKFSFKTSTAGAMNCWNESPSTMNIDYVNFDTVGNEIPDSFAIENIELSPNYTVAVGGRVSDLKPPVIATLENGTRVLVPGDQFYYMVSGSGAGETYTKYGKYTVTAMLKSNTAVTASTDVEFVGIKILNARIEQEDDRVYYVFSGECYGYTADDLMFFDGSKMYDMITEFTDSTVTFKIDVTHLTPGTMIYPHLRVKGTVYYNGGANNNGDIRGNGLTFTNGQTISYNNQTYTLVREWEMPVLKITN